ncbi:actin family [Flagelloscypha sp. PMI_526]|nr:actin family [Flagelloscypha sp. PMI_526]
MEKTGIVIDNGAWSVKAGYAGDKRPKIILPCVVGHPRQPGPCPNYSLIGTSALTRRDTLTMSYPIDAAGIARWQDMEQIWCDIYYRHLRTNPSEHPLLMTEPPLNPRKNRESLVEAMFEHFNVPNLGLATSNSLSLIDSGRKVGVVVDAGETGVRIVPFTGGTKCLDSAVMRLDIGGQELSRVLNKRIGVAEERTSYKTQEEDYVDLCVWAKRNLCYVSLDFGKERRKAATLVASDSEENPKDPGCDFHLPDGRIVSMSTSRYAIPEVIFRPELMRSSTKSLQDAIHECISMCPEETRRELWRNVILSGGTSLFTGFPERLEKELSLLAPPSYKVGVVASDERGYSAWRGGSTLESVAEKESWKIGITRQQYHEFGVNIVHRKRS